MIEVQGVDHIDIFVDNLKESVDFFENKLKLKRVRETSHRGGSVEFKTPPMEVVIEIHQTEPRYNPEVNHIALRVKNIKEAEQDLKSKGVKIDDPLDFYDVTGRWLLGARLPDGMRLQLTSTEPPPK